MASPMATVVLLEREATRTKLAPTPRKRYYSRPAWPSKVEYLCKTTSPSCKKNNKQPC